MAPKTGESLSCHSLFSVHLLWPRVNAAGRGFCLRVHVRTSLGEPRALPLRRRCDVGFASESTHCVKRCLKRFVTAAP